MTTRAELERGDPLERVTFRCSLCRRKWEAVPDRVTEDGTDGHPFRYWADCINCSNKDIPQWAPERTLMKAWASGAGGGVHSEAHRAQLNESLAKARATPSPVRRFNGLKHGLYARTATFWPAKPGEYAACTDCELVEDGCERGQPCMKRTELWFRHHVAFESGDPGMLRSLNADLQSSVRGLIDDMIHTLIREGVSLRSPKMAPGKDGEWSVASYVDPDSGEERLIEEVLAHPLLRHLGDYLAKNNLSLADMGMTAKQRADEDEALGKLAQDAQSQEAALEYQQRQTEALERLQEMIDRSRTKAAADPVLVEYRQGDDDA